MGDDPSSEDESATWSPDAFEPVKDESEPVEDESAPWVSDEAPTTFEPIEQQRTMALQEPQAWSNEPTRQETESPWQGSDYEYTQRLPTPPPQYPPQPPPSGSSGRVIAIAVAAVAAVAVIAVIAIIAIRSGSNKGGTTNPGGGGTAGKSSDVTKCSTPPSYSMTDAATNSSGLTVKLKITASCDGGDVLSSPNTNIAIGTSDGGLDVASGRFDLSSNPIFVPRPGDGAVEQQFVFPPDTYWMPLGMLGDQFTASSPGYRIQSTESGTGSKRSGTASTGATSTYTASGPGTPLGGNSDRAAGNALRAIADADTPVIQRDLAGRWVPQLSSKKVGDYWEGLNWDNSQILHEQLDLRTRFNNKVRLAWSDEWSTYDIENMWVTSAAFPFDAADEALNWCRTNGRNHDNCYAKIISKTMGPSGTTKLLPPG
ncbi:MAG: hypothetical protein QOH60_3963 [Mycobacterium sp.]|jgi:hypothetical protein|nr:hypothetical protein [Mycobacterium sp.]